jgi:hypothetical protein
VSSIFRVEVPWMGRRFWDHACFDRRGGPYSAGERGAQPGWHSGDTAVHRGTNTKGHSCLDFPIMAMAIPNPEDHRRRLAPAGLHLPARLLERSRTATWRPLMPMSRHH